RKWVMLMRPFSVRQAFRVAPETSMSSCVSVSKILILLAGLCACIAVRQTAAAAAEESHAPSWRTVIAQFAQEHFKNPAWGYSHCVRDYQLARELASADHAKLDDEVLYAAAYL